MYIYTILYTSISKTAFTLVSVKWDLTMAKEKQNKQYSFSKRELDNVLLACST